MVASSSRPSNFSLMAPAADLLMNSCSSRRALVLRANSSLSAVRMASSSCCVASEASWRCISSSALSSFSMFCVLALFFSDASAKRCTLRSAEKTTLDRFALTTLVSSPPTTAAVWARLAASDSAPSPPPSVGVASLLSPPSVGISSPLLSGASGGASCTLLSAGLKP